MRIGVSGAHGTGKTTLVDVLCTRLDGHVAIDEPYVMLEEAGYEAELPPSPDDYRAQLEWSLSALPSAAPRVVFDRTPLDPLAYLAAHDVAVEAEVDPARLGSALERLDLLVVLPITEETERVLPTPELRALRRRVNDSLLELVHGDPLEVCGRVPVLEVTVPLDRRPRAVLAALASR